ncbi:MAG: FIST C-terminal domain-containing protein [Candidatus Omnitrophica bacterium]|nr:FIST C-terminal domain-containing protein [Candidatus Omnitrophota bacterium]
MAMQTGTGSSKQLDSFLAGKEAAQKALQKMGQQSADLVLAFSSVKYNQEQVVKGIRSVTGKATLLGCSDAGNITTEGPERKTVAVMAVKSDALRWSIGLGKGIANDAREAGREVAREVLKAHQERWHSRGKVLATFPDGLAGNGADIVRGVQEVIGEGFPIVGGSAGDDFLFQKTFQYYDDQVLSGVVPGILFDGDIRFGIGVRHGWMPIGEAHQATRSQGNLLQEIDGKPAVSIYEEYFGKKAEELRAEPLARMAIVYPLGITLPGAAEYLIRDPITVKEDGSLVCAAEVPQGSQVTLMIGGKEQAIQAAKVAAQQALEGCPKPRFALIFNCIARNKVLGEHVGEEIDAIRSTLGTQADLLGFYTYGEQAPLTGFIGKNCQSQFCNETMVILAIGE